MSQVSWTAEIAERAENCSSIHFFLARGTGEAYPGKVADIANGACAQLGGTCDYEDIIYPAYTNDTTGFCMSIEAGVQNGTKQLTDYAERCPDSKLVLGGYSQGGQLVTDVLGGAGGFLWGDCEQSSSPELNYASVGSHVAAVYLFGDARHTANQPYNYLNGSAYNSSVPRTLPMLDALDQYANKIRSYCEESDPVCANGTDIQTHLSYFDYYTGDAISWVVSTLKGAA
ncbi:hypothetical protein Plec18167_008329 [Paecilomyces lecythidis]|uniref:Cutinase n=1 Tax=Paecilomyces lecythidis TaxID=3004212 RepID=A0ABR3WXS1_9EURO